MTFVRSPPASSSGLSAPARSIFHQGDAGTPMFIVATGHVNIHLPGEASQRVSLKDITVGEYFGELALFDDKPRRRARSRRPTPCCSSSIARRSPLPDAPPAAAMAAPHPLERLRETNAMLTERAAKNVVEEIEKNLTWSRSLADKVAELTEAGRSSSRARGTLRWCVIITAAFGFDPYPYQRFNLVLADLVGLQGPLIVMSQNRPAMKDRAQAETDFKVNLKNEVNIETLLASSASCAPRRRTVRAGRARYGRERSASR